MCENALLTGVRFTTTEGGRAVVVVIPVGTNIFVIAHAEKVVKDNGAERLARFWPTCETNRRQR